MCEVDGPRSHGVIQCPQNSVGASTRDGRVGGDGVSCNVVVREKALALRVSFRYNFEGGIMLTLDVCSHPIEAAITNSMVDERVGGMEAT